MSHTEPNETHEEPAPHSAEEDERAPRSSDAGATEQHAAAHPYRTSSHGGDGSDHGFAHEVSVQLLAAVLGALIVLTVVTVAVTKVDLGGQWNLIVAMAIATVKATLVIAFFMHLFWDKKFNLLVLLSGLAFVILFIGGTLTDRAEYQPDIDKLERLRAQQQQKK